MPLDSAKAENFVALGVTAYISGKTHTRNDLTHLISYLVIVRKVGRSLEVDKEEPCSFRGRE